MWKLRNFSLARFTVWKNEKNYSHQKIFRQINSLVIHLVKPLISRNFCHNAWENSRNFHSVHFWQKFRESNRFTKAKDQMLVKSWFHEIFFRWEKNFWFFHTVSHRFLETFAWKQRELVKQIDYLIKSRPIQCMYIYYWNFCDFIKSL